MGCCGQNSLKTEEQTNKYKAEVKGTEVPVVEDADKAKENIESAKNKANVNIEATKNETKENVNNIKNEDILTINKAKNTAKEVENKVKAPLTFNEIALAHHNELRAKHGCPPLKLNNELCKIAENYAKKLASENKLQHSTNKYKGENLGENLYFCSGMDIDPKNMTQSWYDEIKKYDFNSNNFIPGTGHFTQVVWKNTTDVGFGIASGNGANYGVANYYKAGNFQGEFKENVPKLK